MPARAQQRKMHSGLLHPLYRRGQELSGKTLPPVLLQSCDVGDSSAPDRFVLPPQGTSADVNGADQGLAAPGPDAVTLAEPRVRAEVPFEVRRGRAEDCCPQPDRRLVFRGPERAEAVRH